MPSTVTFKQFVIQPEDTGEWLALLCEGVGKTQGRREGSVEAELKSKQGLEKWPSRRRERHKSGQAHTRTCTIHFSVGSLDYMFLFVCLAIIFISVNLHCTKRPHNKRTTN